MRENNAIGAIPPNDRKGISPLKQGDDQKDNSNVSTDISPDKPPSTTANNANSDDISPEGLLEVIS